MVLALGLAFFFESQATTTVILVRHADVAVGRESALSPAGAVRAEELARVLADADVVQGVDAILASGLGPTQETAAPLARRLSLPVEPMDSSDIKSVVERILKDHKGEIVLVIADAETIPRLIPEFHGSKKVPPMADNEYDNLYVVSIPWYGKVKTLRFRYGARPGPNATVAPQPDVGF